MYTPIASWRDGPEWFVIPEGITRLEGGVTLPRIAPREGDPIDTGGVDRCSAGMGMWEGEAPILGVDEGVSRSGFESNGSSSSSSEWAL